MPALSNVSNTTATAVSSDSSNTVYYGVTVKADGNNNGVLFVGLANTVTAGLVNSNTAGDATVGFPLFANQSYTFTPAQFKRAAKDPLASNVFVIASAINQRVYFDSY